MKKSAKQKLDAPMIQIGASKDSVAAAGKAVMDILYSPAGSAEKIAALDTLGRICNVNGSTIQNCNFSTK